MTVSGVTSKPGRPASSVFLCHNSADKPLVKEIADRLELDFGVPHFLDSFAIPTGEAFKPWIERALGNSSGCAIFLGASGWGPTHLWEATLAASRKRAEPAFRLIPVALPGVDEAETVKLENGEIFRDLNWVDLRSGISEQDDLDRLYTAVTGEPLPEGRGPAKLTPYQIRRDAARWMRSNPPDTSILYRGSQLQEAERLTRINAGLAGVEEIGGFLVASASRQRTVWRRLATAAAVGVIAVLALAARSEQQRQLAERGRVLAVSRQLALEAQAERTPVPSLLLAAQAYTFVPSAEASASLLQRIQAWPSLERVFHSAAGPLTKAVWHKGRASLIGSTATGHLVEWHPPGDAPPIGFSRASTGEVRSVAVDSSGDVWAGYEDGRVLIWDANGRRTTVSGIPPKVDTSNADAVNTLQFGPPIAAIAFSADGVFAAVGTADGTEAGAVFLVDAKTKSVTAGPIAVGVPRVNALDFDQQSGLVLAGTGFGPVLLLDRGGRIVRRLDVRQMGEILAAGFTEGGDVTAVDDAGRVVVWERSRSFQIKHMFTTRDGLTSAAIRADGQRIGLGDGTGLFHLVDVRRQVVLTSLRALGGAVRGIEWDASGDRVVTAGADGTAAVWNLRQISPVVSTGPSVPLSPHALRPLPDGTVLVATASVGAAGVWKISEGNASLERDLLGLTRAALGDSALAFQPGQTQDAFVPVATPEIELTHIDANGNRIVWATRDGAVLWTALSGKQAVTVLKDRSRAGPVQALALSDDGRFAAVAYREPSLLIFELPTAGTVQVALEAPARSLAFSHGGTLLAVGLESGEISLRRVPAGDNVAEAAVPHTSAAGNVTFLAGDRLLASNAVVGAGAETAITVRPVPKLQSAKALVARSTGTAPSMLAAAEGIMAGVNADGTVDFWDANSDVPVGSIKVSDTALSAAAFAPDQRSLWVADSDGGVYRITVGGASWLALACQLAGRPLTPAEWSQFLGQDEYHPACTSGSGR